MTGEDIPDNRDAVVALVPALSIAHLAAGCVLNVVLFDLAGGTKMERCCIRYDGIEYTWTSLPWVPGELLIGAEGGAVLGWLVLLVGSGAAGLVAASVLVGIVSRTRNRFGCRAWRVWAALILWCVWVPVPVRSSFAYWWYTAAH